MEVPRADDLAAQIRRAAGKTAGERIDLGLAECLARYAGTVDLAVVAPGLLRQRHGRDGFPVVTALDAAAGHGLGGRRGEQQRCVVGRGPVRAFRLQRRAGFTRGMQQRHAESAIGGRHHRFLVERDLPGRGVVARGHQVPDLAQQRLATGDGRQLAAPATDHDGQAAGIVHEQAVAGLLRDVPLGDDALHALVMAVAVRAGARGRREDERLQREALAIEAAIGGNHDVRTAVDFLRTPLHALVAGRGNLRFLEAGPFRIGVAVDQAHELDVVALALLGIYMEFERVARTHRILVAVASDAKHVVPRPAGFGAIARAA